MAGLDPAGRRADACPWLEAVLIFFYGFYGLSSGCRQGFMILDAHHCIRNDPDRNLWLWIYPIREPRLPMGQTAVFFTRFAVATIARLPSMKSWLRRTGLPEIGKPLPDRSEISIQIISTSGKRA